MTAMTPFIKRHALAAFFTLACGLTWFGVWASDALCNGTLLLIALALPLALLIPGPLITALIVTAITNGKLGLRALLHSLTHFLADRRDWGSRVANMIIEQQCVAMLIDQRV